jgi:hypothetical protein
MKDDIMSMDGESIDLPSIDNISIYLCLDNITMYLLNFDNFIFCQYIKVSS